MRCSCTRKEIQIQKVWCSGQLSSAVGEEGRADLRCRAGRREPERPILCRIPWGYGRAGAYFPPQRKCLLGQTLDQLMAGSSTLSVALSLQGCSCEQVGVLSHCWCVVAIRPSGVFGERLRARRA